MSELLIETIRRKRIHWRTRDKAIKAIIRMSKDKDFDFRDHPNLKCAFLWSDTPEGGEFWNKICHAEDKEEK